MDISTHKRRKLLPAAAAVLFSLSVFSATAFATSNISPQGQEINAGVSQGTQGTIDDAPQPPDVSNGATDPSSGGQTDPESSNGGGDNQNSSDTNGQSSSGTDQSGGTESGITSNPDETISSQPAEEPGETESSSRPTSHEPSPSKAPVYVAPPAGVASADPDSRAPTDFTSDDLQGLLSGAGSGLASTDGFLREDTPTNGSSSGGTSSLLLGGIALILAGVAGVVLFVYRQFFLNRRRSAPAGVTGPLPAIPMPKPAPKKAPSALPQALDEGIEPTAQAQPQEIQSPVEAPTCPPANIPISAPAEPAAPTATALTGISSLRTFRRKILQNSRKSTILWSELFLIREQSVKIFRTCFTFGTFLGKIITNMLH